MKCFLVVSRHVTDVSQCSEWKVQYSEKATTIPQSLHGKKFMFMFFLEQTRSFATQALKKVVYSIYVKLGLKTF